MKTLRDYNNQYKTNTTDEYPTGIKCPICKEELYFSNPSIIISESLDITMISCPACGFSGARKS